MSHQHVSPRQAPLVSEARSLGQLTEALCAPMERRPSWRWWWAFGSSLAVLTLGGGLVASALVAGGGVQGQGRAVSWAFDITSFVCWVGIGHAGTLLSALLFLFRQRWRTGIHRAAEAMTLLAVLCAMIFTLRSPLLWDVLAVSAYFTLSGVFWFVGLLPDLATVRDRARGLRKRIFQVLSLGWDGSNRTWSRYETVYLLLAGLATPLALSVHALVSMDFAAPVVARGPIHLFPSHFVTGAVYSGFAMVLTLMIVIRSVLGFEHLIPPRHLESMTKIIIVTGSLVLLAYGVDFLIAWDSGSPYERLDFLNRAFEPYSWAYWALVACSVVVPHLFWFKRVRTSPAALFALSLVINVGMGFERFVLIVTSRHRDFVPSSWSLYRPTAVEMGTFLGTFGLFFTLFLLFTRVLPIISIGEVKNMLGFARKDLSV